MEDPRRGVSQDVAEAVTKGKESPLIFNEALNRVLGDFLKRRFGREMVSVSCHGSSPLTDEDGSELARRLSQISENDIKVGENIANANEGYHECSIYLKTDIGTLYIGKYLDGPKDDRMGRFYLINEPEPDMKRLVEWLRKKG